MILPGLAIHFFSRYNEVRLSPESLVPSPSGRGDDVSAMQNGTKLSGESPILETVRNWTFLFTEPSS